MKQSLTLLAISLGDGIALRFGNFPTWAGFLFAILATVAGAVGINLLTAACFRTRAENDLLSIQLQNAMDRLNREGIE